MRKFFKRLFSKRMISLSEILVFKKAEPCTEQKDEKDVYILSSIFPNEDVMHKVDEIMRQKSEENKKTEPCTEQKDEKDVYILSSIFPNEDVMYKVDEIMRQKSEEENKTDKTH